MPAPYDYLGRIQPVDLAPQIAGITAGIGQSITAALESRVAEQQALAAQQQAQLQAEQQAAMQAERVRDFQAFMRNPSREGLGGLLAKHPQFRKQLEDAQKLIGEDERAAAMSFVGPTLNYLQSGNYDLAIENIERRNEALANSNVPNKEALIANGKNMIRAIIRGDEGVNAAIATLMQDYAAASGVSDPGELMKSLAGLPHEGEYARGRAEEISAKAEKAKVQARLEEKRILTNIGLTEQQANEAATRARVMVQRQKLDEQIYRDDYELKALEALRKGQNGGFGKEFTKPGIAHAQNATSAQMLSDRAAELAGKASNLKPLAGVFGRAQSLLVGLFGSESEAEKFRNDYKDLRSRLAIPLLAGLKGASSDKDVQLVLSPVPDVYTNPAMLESFLVGMAKTQKFNQMLEEAQLEWLAQNGNLGYAPAGGQITVLGRTVPAGTPLNRFLSEQRESIFSQAAAEVGGGRTARGPLGRFEQPLAGQQQSTTPSEPEQTPMYIFP